MSITRELLRKWAELEPEACKLETRPNVDWHEEFEDFYIASEAGNPGGPGHGWGWQLVFTDKEPEAYYPWKSEALMRIQWAVQEAVVKRNLPLDIHYGKTAWDVFIDGYEGFAKEKETVTEALLEAYIDYLENNTEGNL